MSREPDPSRKAELLDQILEHLLDRPLATVTFRTLAAALDVSTFTLVYHFGTRAELLGDIVGAISAREREIQAELERNQCTVDAYFEALDRSWEWSVRPRTRQLRRLEFEASMMEAQGPNGHGFTRALYEHWQRIGKDALLRFGLIESDAETESRLIVDSMFGIQYDLVVNQDVERATGAFRLMTASHRARVEALVAARPSRG